MMCSFKKMWSAFAASLVVVSGVVTGACDDRCGDCPTLCSPRPVVNVQCGNWFANADLLLWRACEEGLGYGVEYNKCFGDSDDNSCEPFAQTTNAKVKNLHPEWDFGFRLGLGYNFACDGWDLTGSWTHFHTQQHSKSESFFAPDSATNGSDNFFVPFGIAFDDESFPDRAKANWSLRLNFIDLELGREFCVSKCFSLRPFVGLRYARIDQKFDLSADANRGCCDDYSDYDNDSVVFQNFSDNRSQFWGVGVRGGLESEWNLGCGFSIYGQTALSALYGQFKVHHHGGAVDFESFDDSFDVHQKDEYCSCKAIADFALGARWKQFYCADTVAVTIQLAWEQHHLWGQNRFETGVIAQNEVFDTGSNSEDFTFKSPQTNNGDLCVSGFTLSAKVDF